MNAAPKCNCGGSDFVELKMGGHCFSLQWASKWVLWKGSGFTPRTVACRSCGMVHFFIPEGQAHRLEEES